MAILLSQPNMLGFQVCAPMPWLLRHPCTAGKGSEYIPPTPFTLHTTGLSVSAPALQLGGFSRLSSSNHSCYGSTAPVKLDPAVAGHSTDLSVSLV